MAHNNIILPPEFSGEGQLILFTRYGDPRATGFENKWITDWKVEDEFPWFPIHALRIHKHFRSQLRDAFRELELLDLHTEIKSIHDCYTVRDTRSAELNQSPVLSVHSWGAALDINADDNPIGSKGTWSDTFLSVMDKYKVFCGQNWSGRKDPMHFAMVNG